MKQKQLPEFDLPYEVGKTAISNNLAEIMENLDRIERSLPLSLADKIRLSISSICFGLSYYFFAEFLSLIIASH